MKAHRRIAPPEFWRFLFILFICFLHFEEDVFDRNHIIANAGYLGVDFFLLLSGFVVALNHYSNPIQSTFRFAWGRVRKLYPDFLFALILMFLLWVVFDNQNGIIGIASHLWSGKYQLVFANALFPTGLEMRSIWFLSFWLIGIIVLAATLKRGYLKFVGALAISFMSWHVFNQGSLFNDPVTHEYLWSIRLIKCVSEVIIGALAFDAFNQLKGVHFSKIGKILMSLLEIAAIAFVLIIMSRRGRNMMDYEVCVAFVLIIILSFLNQTYLSNLLDNKVSLFLGKMSLPIYLYHLFVVKLVSVYWHSPEDNKLVAYFVTFGAIIVSSYLFHLFVEKCFKPGLEFCCNKLIIKEK